MWCDARCRCSSSERIIKRYKSILNQSIFHQFTCPACTRSDRIGLRRNWRCSPWICRYGSAFLLLRYVSKGLPARRATCRDSLLHRWRGNYRNWAWRSPRIERLWLGWNWRRRSLNKASCSRLSCWRTFTRHGQRKLKSSTCACNQWVILTSSWSFSSSAFEGRALSYSLLVWFLSELLDPAWSSKFNSSALIIAS